jgi:uncharacterized BrkB/YihY/UPF0761 family membrane protein
VSASRSTDSLEFRLHKIHQRHRREFIRQLMTMTFWGVGLLAMLAFVVALAIGTVSR